MAKAAATPSTTQKRSSKKSKKPSVPARLEADLIAEAMDYRRQGHGHGVIAEAMSIPVPKVIELIEKGLRSVHLEPAKEQAILRIERLNTMLPQIYANAISGESEAANTVMKIETELARLKVLLIPDVSTVFGGHASLLALAGLKGLGPKKNGRPEHKPTETTVALVEGLVMARASHDTIAKIIGISVNTLTKHYEAILEVSKERLIGEMATIVATDARRGSVESAKWILTRQGGDDWKDTRPPPPKRPDGDDGVLPPPMPVGDDGEPTLRITGGLPPPPPEWATPPGMVEALRAEGKNVDAFDEVPPMIDPVPPEEPTQ